MELLGCSLKTYFKNSVNDNHLDTPNMEIISPCITLVESHWMT